jgi:hypothetical protein
VILCVGLGALYWNRAQQNELEKQARVAIAALNGLPVLDANQQHVVSLNLQLIKEDAQIKQAMQWVGKLPYLQILDLSGTTVSDADLAVVSSLSNLNSLHLNGTGVTDECLRHVVPLRQLQGLHLADTGVTDRSIEQIVNLQSLIHLDLSQTAVAGGIAQLAEIASLKWLLLRDIPLDPPILNALEKLTEIQRLTVGEELAASESLKLLKEKLSRLSID